MAFLGFATFFFCSSEAVLWNYSYREARPQVLFFEKDSTEYSVWSRMAVGRRIRRSNVALQEYGRRCPAAEITPNRKVIGDCDVSGFSNSQKAAQKDAETVRIEI